MRKARATKSPKWHPWPVPFCLFMHMWFFSTVIFFILPADKIKKIFSWKNYFDCTKLNCRETICFEEQLPIFLSWSATLGKISPRSHQKKLRRIAHEVYHSTALANSHLIAFWCEQVNRAFFHRLDHWNCTHHQFASYSLLFADVPVVSSCWPLLALFSLVSSFPLVIGCWECLGRSPHRAPAVVIG